LPLGVGTIITAGIFTRAFLDTAKAYPRMDRLFVAVMTLGVVVIAFGAAGFEREAKVISFPVMAVGALVNLGGGLRALRGRAPGGHFYVAGWAIIFAAAATAFAVNTPLLAGSTADVIDLLRVGIALDALMMALAVAVRVSRLRSEHDESTRRDH